MFKSFYRAFKLELSHLRETWVSTAFAILAPSLLIMLFYNLANKPITWSQFYTALNITFYDFYASVIIPLLILFVTAQMTVLRIVGERAPYGTLDRELINISRTGMYFGKLVAQFIFAIIQVVLLFVTAFIWFPLKNFGTPGTIIPFLILIALTGIVLGLAASIFSRSKEFSIQAVQFLVIGFFLVSLILIDPTMNIPQNVKNIVSNTPIALVSQSLQNVMLKGVGFEDVANQAVALSVWILGLMGLSLLKFNLERER